MKSAIRKMDRAIKQLYNLEHDFKAESFLVSNPMTASTGKGAFYIRADEEEEVRIGIFLDAQVRNELSDLHRWNPSDWNQPQLGAFTIAAEEVSHFNYFLHHQLAGRPVSQLEMETQGEVDKFLLTFLSGFNLMNEKQLLTKFERLLEQFFERYRLAEHLDEEQCQRYEEANRLAQHFLSKYKAQILDLRKWERTLRLLRRFYRVNLSEKLSLSRK